MQFWSEAYLAAQFPLLTTALFLYLSRKILWWGIWDAVGVNSTAPNLGEPRERTPKLNSKEGAGFKLITEADHKNPSRTWKNLSVVGPLPSVVCKRKSLGQLGHKELSKSRGNNTLISIRQTSGQISVLLLSCNSKNLTLFLWVLFSLQKGTKYAFF